MDFNLTEGQRMLQKVVREFVEREIEPIAAEIDKRRISIRDVSEDDRSGAYGHINTGRIWRMRRYGRG